VGGNFLSFCFGIKPTLDANTSAQLSPQGVTLSCKNCTIGVNVEITQGSFRLGNSSGVVGFLKDTADFFRNGSVQVVTNDLFAHIELAAKFDLSEKPLEFAVPLPAIPLTPFVVSLFLPFILLLELLSAYPRLKDCHGALLTGTPISNRYLELSSLAQ